MDSKAPLILENAHYQVFLGCLAYIKSALSIDREPSFRDLAWHRHPTIHEKVAED